MNCGVWVPLVAQLLLQSHTSVLPVETVGPPEHAQDMGAAAGSGSQSSSVWECLVSCIAEVHNICRSSSAFVLAL